MELLKIILSSVLGSLVTGIFAVIVWKLNREAHKEDEAAEQDENFCTARGEKLEQLRHDVDILKEATGIQFYNEIKHRAKKYIARKYITFEEYEDLQRDYTMYHDKDKLDMNGFLKGVMEDVEHLEKRVS